MIPQPASVRCLAHSVGHLGRSLPFASLAAIGDRSRSASDRVRPSPASRRRAGKHPRASLRLKTADDRRVYCFVPTSLLAAFHGSHAGRNLFGCGLIDISSGRPAACLNWTIDGYVAPLRGQKRWRRASRLARRATIILPAPTSVLYAESGEAIRLPRDERYARNAMGPQSPRADQFGPSSGARRDAIQAFWPPRRHAQT